LISAQLKMVHDANGDARKGVSGLFASDKKTHDNFLQCINYVGHNSSRHRVSAFVVGRVGGRRVKPEQDIAGRSASPARAQDKAGDKRDRLSDLTAFGSNPGQLRARLYTPENLRVGAPLVVVLHGCTQTAADYDSGSGWSVLADRLGFALLFPEQQRGNNPNLCFNWFLSEDAKRDAGEPLSIRQMIETVVAARGIDRSRVFVTGLSAGGAMAAIMLATYPEIFAGGAIIAGLPYGCAKTVPEAFERMRGNGLADGDTRVREASGHNGPWPILSVWHGTADPTVHPANAEAIVRQWQTVHNLDASPSRTELVDNYPRRMWCDATGRVVIEMYSITGMAHGTPLATTGDEAFGAIGPHMLEANICSTRRIAEFWGLTDSVHAGQAPQSSGHSWTSDLQKAITDALRAAGLMT
jgi:poly(hydroxyalkanoate) depolymerase family esterase